MYQNSCYATCPPGTYGDSDYKCKRKLFHFFSSHNEDLACPSGCATCWSQNICLSCVAPNNLYGYQCMNPCPSGYYASGQVCFSHFLLKF